MGPDIKCFGLVIFLDFHFNVLQQQQKNTIKRNESKQSTQYLLEQNLILKTTEWMIYKALPPLAAVPLLG